MIIKTDTDIELNFSLSNIVVYEDKINYNEWTIYYLDWWEIGINDRQMLIDIFDIDDNADFWDCVYVIHNSLTNEFKLYVTDIDYLGMMFDKQLDIFKQYISEWFGQEGLIIELTSNEIKTLYSRKKSETDELNI